MWNQCERYILLNVKSCGCGILRYLLDQDAPENLWAQISHHIFPHVHHVRYEQYSQCWLHDVYHTQLCQQLLQRFLPHSYQRLKELTCPRTMACQSWLRKLQFITAFRLPTHKRIVNYFNHFNIQGRSPNIQWRRHYKFCLKNTSWDHQE